jgi:hypothetical protein
MKFTQYKLSNEHTHGKICDPGGAARDLKEGDEGAVEDCELDRIFLPKQCHPDDRICPE